MMMSRVLSSDVPPASSKTATPKAAQFSTERRNGPEAFQPLAPVQGHLDPELLRAGGPELDREIAAIRAAFGAAPFVFNLGHGILPDTPIAHVERLVELVRA